MSVYNLYRLQNIDLDDVTLKQQYYDEFFQGNITNAHNIVANNSQLNSKVLNANTLQKLVNEIINLEEYYYNGVEDVLHTHLTNFQLSIDELIYSGAYSNLTQYDKNNIVNYREKSLLSNTSISTDGYKNIGFEDGGFYGNSSQVTTTGKNKFPTQRASGYTTTQNGVTILVQSNGGIKITGTSTVAYDSFWLIGTFSTTPIIYTLNGNYIATRNSTNASSTVTLSFGNSIVDRQFATQQQSFSLSNLDIVFSRIILQTSGVTYNETIYPQLELGSSSTSYEPYTGGIPSPNPNYPQTINNVSSPINLSMVGKNLFPNTRAIGYTTTQNGVTMTVQSDGGINFVGTLNASYTDFYLAPSTSLVLNGTYTRKMTSTNPSTTVAPYYADGLGAFVQLTTTSISTNYATPFTIQFTFVRLSTSGTTYNETIYPQLELGSSSTTYSPYSSTPYTIPLSSPLRKVGTIQDEILKLKKDTTINSTLYTKGTWVLKRNVGTIVLNGSSEGTWMSTTGSAGVVYFNLTGLNLNCFRNYLTTTSSHFTPITSLFSNGQDLTFAIANDFVNIRYLEKTTVPLFTTWLSTNNVTIQYELQTPTFEVFDTPTQAILNSIPTMKNELSTLYTTQSNSVNPYINVFRAETSSNYTEMYYCYNQPPTIGVLPTDNRYYIYLGNKGDNGYESLGVTYKGQWSSATSYIAKDMVAYNNLLYVCKTANTNNLPTNTTYWQVALQLDPQGIYVSATEPPTIKEGQIWIKILP